MSYPLNFLCMESSTANNNFTSFPILTHFFKCFNALLKNSRIILSRNGNSLFLSFKENASNILSLSMRFTKEHR